VSPTGDGYPSGFDRWPESGTITGPAIAGIRLFGISKMSLQTSLDYLHAVELPTPFPVGPITVYLADAPGEPLTLIDTGPRTQEAQAALEHALAEWGHAPEDLDLLVVTHAHADHFGLAADLASASGARVWTHPWNDPTLTDYDADSEYRGAFYAALLCQTGIPLEALLQLGQATRGMRRFVRSVPVDSHLDEGDRLWLAGREWTVLHTPGHAIGLICLYEPVSQTLLSSDHLLADISSNPVVEPPLPGQTERFRSLALYRDSLSRVAAMSIAQALPSHGPVIRDVPGLVAQRLSFHEKRLARVLEALSAGGGTTWQVTQALFPARSPLDTFLAVSEVIGHLDLLEIEGQIGGEVVDGVIHWHRAGL